jgi:hypothetical protein
VAQLNSALDYGSRGYWFESSQGHKTPTNVGVFLCFEVKNIRKINKNQLYLLSFFLKREVNIKLNERGSEKSGK